MAKRKGPKRRLWPASHDKQTPFDIPGWNLGSPPGPDEPERWQEFYSKSVSYFADRDRIEDAEKERLLGEWLQFLKAADYKEALLQLAALLEIPAFHGLVELPDDWVPAFRKKRVKDGVKRRGATPGKKRLGLMRRLSGVEEIKAQNPELTDRAALLEYNPELKSLKPAERKKRLNKEAQYLSHARALRRADKQKVITRIRSPIPR